MEYITGMIWYALWPIVILLSIKFVTLNLQHYEKMERLEELEALHAEGKLQE
jgi:hypothetical protein